MACASFLLQKGVVSFIATDAHSAGHRRPVLSKRVRVAGKIIGKEKAMKMVTTNPEAMLAGELAVVVCVHLWLIQSTKHPIAYSFFF